jgi:hypothetical protein
LILLVDIVYNVEGHTVTLTFDIEGPVMHFGSDIGYYIALSQHEYHSLRSRTWKLPLPRLYHAWAKESQRHVL